MINKKLFLFLILSIFLISIVSAQVSYCCEMTTAGAWCQNSPQEECNEEYRSVPTSCEATSYCKLGVCINTKEGTCMPNSPQKVCQDPNGDGDNSDGGVWDERDKSDIPQCQLGCCLIGDQAAFVTLTRCKSLASTYGLEINYRTDIQSEIECIANARPKVKGACVYEYEYQRTCKFTTKKECQNMQGNQTGFHEGFLCSAESLETICGPSKKTTCVEGRDEVYFLDSCGNLANVYDASKVNELSYWEKIIAPNCGDGEGNKDSTTCGDCDYFLGSTCKKGNANYGNFICEDLGCEYEGENYQHGETWCARTVGDDVQFGTNPGITNANSPGGKDFRLVCYNGEVSVEPCAEFRQEVCLQSSIPTSGEPFKTAACRVNMWQDCYSQDNEKDCINTAKRDCKWIEGSNLIIEGEGGKIETSCFPLYAPGFDFWEEETDATSMCSLANDVCVVHYEAGFAEGAFISGIFGGDVDWKTKENPCVDENGNLKEEWKNKRKDVCSAIGDCGSKKNYIGGEGYFDWESSFVREGKTGEDEEGILGSLFGLFG